MPKAASKPERLRARRVKGWRLPETAVYVGRPSRWGNPFVIGRDGDRAACVAKHRVWIMEPKQAALRDEVARELHGKDLACWCPLDEPCHAETLLEIANH